MVIPDYFGSRRPYGTGSFFIPLSMNSRTISPSSFPSSTIEDKILTAVSWVVTFLYGLSLAVSAS
jgi:hypothetical protein